MAQPKYIISVAGCGDTALAGPVVAVALIYPADMTAPLFRCGQETFSVEGWAGIPSPQKKAALDYLRTTASSVASLIITPAELRESKDAHGDTLELMGYATVRVMERFLYERPALNNTTPKDYSWYVYGTAPLPEKLAYGKQQLFFEPGHIAWQAAAADALAQNMRNGFMMRAAGRYPQYKFEKNMGLPTKAHKSAIKQHGMCAEHWRES